MNIFYESLRILSMIFTVPFYFLRGIYALSRLHKPIVAIFGGKRALHENGHAHMANELGRMLAEKNMSVITGGGPGIMSAANCGVASAKENAQSWTLGITLNRLDNDYTNPCAKVITVKYFFIRKWLLSRYSDIHIFMPGGLGTADELFNILNLKKHSMLNQPIILIDQNYWQPLISWYQQSREQEYIPLPIEKAFHVCNSAEEACTYIEKELNKKPLNKMEHS